MCFLQKCKFNQYSSDHYQWLNKEGQEVVEKKKKMKTPHKPSILANNVKTRKNSQQYTLTRCYADNQNISKPRPNIRILKDHLKAKQTLISRPYQSSHWLLYKIKNIFFLFQNNLSDDSPVAPIAVK